MFQNIHNLTFPTYSDGAERTKRRLNASIHKVDSPSLLITEIHLRILLSTDSSTKVQNKSLMFQINCIPLHQECWQEIDDAQMTSLTPYLTISQRPLISLVTTYNL